MKPYKSMDGMLPSKHEAPKPVINIKPQKPAFAAPEPIAKQEHSQPPTRPSKSRLRRLLGLIGQIVLLVILISLGFTLRSVAVGQIALIVYAAFAFVFKIASRTTFYMALISLVVVLFATLRADTAFAGTFAMYAFLLLIIGLVSLGLELRREV